MGVEDLCDGDNEMSKNASRTGTRGVVSQFFRRRLRKEVLLKVNGTIVDEILNILLLKLGSKQKTLKRNNLLRVFLVF